ncbi:hypothetical protein VTN31DRAFT_6669 [Thermomyces dupontii]|uniref:uncharacterized protein n=1 Tax=Talaromyces thermophilus TaxID=28565 RepID=UPI003742DD87
MSSFLPVNRSAPSEDVSMKDTPQQQSAEETSKPAEEADAKQNSAAPTGDQPAASDEARSQSNGTNNNADGSAPPKKKKKGQRFFCTDFPPCTLSFTRSEHLARHIRKHTGERPFQCHCSRRFSRLDNLRQHAQTVHVNEEIPGDSLAATGTRFQRQVRTDRVRTQGRARAGTTGSQSSHARKHSRNLSTSSVASTASTYSQPPDFRQRPPPLMMMPNDGTARAHLSLSNGMGEPSTPPSQVTSFPTQSPTAGFAAGGAAGSPQYGSPASTIQQGYWEESQHGRRLSIPSAPNPMAGAPQPNYPPPYLSPMLTTAAHSSTTTGSVFASPANSSYTSRDESASEAELRRRTWHPSTYYPRPATSGVAQYEPNVPRPAFGGENSGEQKPRLPGIESFDRVLRERPLTPPIRNPDTLNRGPTSQPFTSGPASTTHLTSGIRPQPPISGPGHRRGQMSWDLHYNLTGLSLGGSNPPKEAWAHQTLGEINKVGSQFSAPYRPSTAGTLGQQDRDAARGPEPATSQPPKPFPWQGASHIPRTSPEDSSSSEGVATPSTSAMEYHPAIVHSNGYVEPPKTGAPAPAQPPFAPSEPRPGFLGAGSGAGGMGRLEALVAVATSENKAAARLF